MRTTMAPSAAPPATAAPTAVVADPQHATELAASANGNVDALAAIFASTPPAQLPALVLAAQQLYGNAMVTAATAKHATTPASRAAEAAYEVDAAVDLIVEQYRRLVDERIAGIDELVAEMAKHDPPVKPGFWEELAKGLALTALDHVTGHLASAIAQRLVDPEEQRFLHGFLLGQERKVISHVQQHLTKLGAKGGGKSSASGGPPVHADVAFFGAQRAALGDLVLEISTGMHELGRRYLGKEERRAGSGVAPLAAIRAGFAAQVGTARVDQRRESFMAWNRLMAQSDSRIRGKDATGASASGATKVENAIDVSDQGNGYFPLWSTAKIPGLLRLSLRREGPAGLAIAEAHLSGYDSSFARNTIRGMKIGELAMPIVAELHDSPDPAYASAVDGIHLWGFAVAKDESGRCYAKDHGSAYFASSVVAMSPTQLAERVFAQLATQTLGEVKG